MMERKEEVRELLRLSAEQVRERAAHRLTVTEDVEELHEVFARRMLAEIRGAAREGRACKLIVPVGPTGQYPVLARLVASENVDLKHCWFFFMDEYAGDDGRALPEEHPLSFKKQAKELFFSRLDEGLLPAPDQIVFPDDGNIGELGQMIEDLGGVDVCFGGIGIHGHVAFNEPEEGVAGMGPRKVRLNDFTVTINAVRAHVGGNLECFPRHAFTLGMREILSADRIVLFCRNGCEFDWANTVLRLALLGEPGDDYPVTHIRPKDYHIVTDEETLQSPQNLI